MTYDDLRPEVPGGIRAVVYDPDGNRHDERNLAAEGGRLAMTEGRHSILFYNNNTEYIVFNDLTSSATATATTRTRTRAGFSELHKDERTVGQPDMLYGSYLGEYEAKPGYEAVSLPVELRPLVYTYVVRCEFSHGAQYVALARGALAGMAESVYLQDGHTGSGAATVFFDATVCDWGSWAQVRSFGIPDWPGDGYTRATDRNYTLQLEVRLKNGKYLPPFMVDITEQVKAQPRGGVIVITGLEVSDEDGESGGSGFDVEVGDWGDRHEYELPV
jgi:hypothetical protein